MTTAKKLVYTLKAVYEGESEVARLNKDLKTLGTIKALEGIQRDFASTNKEFVAAKKRLRDLKKELQSSKDPKLAQSLAKVALRSEELSIRHENQQAALSRLETELESARLKQAAYGGDTKKNTALVAALTRRHERQKAALVNTGAALKKTSLRAQELGEAWQKSSDPKILNAYKKAEYQVKKLSGSIRKQKQSMDEARTSLKAAGVAAGDLAGEYKRLEIATTEQGRQMAAMSHLGVRSFAEIEKEIHGLRQAYRELERSGTMSFRELGVAKDRMRSKISALKEQTNGWTKHIGRVQQAWGGVLGVITAVAGAAKGLQLFAGFDDSMRRVKAVSGATKKDLRDLTALAKKMGRETRFSATDAAQGMEELAQSGQSVREIYSTLPHAMNMAAIAGGTIKESADLSTDTLKQFNLTADRTGHVTDVLTRGYTQASTSLTQLGEALTYAGPVASSFGYSLEDTVAILDAYAEAGFKGSRGGTAMVGGLTRLVKPSQEAAAVLEKYNIQVFDGAGKVKNFADIIEDLGRAALSPTEMMTLFGQEAGPGMAGLLAQGAGAIRGFRAGLEDVDGTAAKLATDMESGLGGALRSLGSSLSAVTLAFAATLAPAIKVVAQLLTVLARSISALPEPLKVLVGVTGGLVMAFAAWHLGLKHLSAALRLAVLDVGALIGKGRALIGWLSELSGALGGVTQVLVAFTVGWAIGKMLNQFDAVKRAGVLMAEGLTIAFLKVKQAWAWLSGGDTAAIQREIDETKRIYNEMFDEIGRKATETAGIVQDAHRKMTTVPPPTQPPPSQPSSGQNPPSLSGDQSGSTPAAGNSGAGNIGPASPEQQAARVKKATLSMLGSYTKFREKSTALMESAMKDQMETFSGSMDEMGDKFKKFDEGFRDMLGGLQSGMKKFASMGMDMGVFSGKSHGMNVGGGSKRQQPVQKTPTIKEKAESIDPDHILSEDVRQELAKEDSSRYRHKVRVKGVPSARSIQPGGQSGPEKPGKKQPEKVVEVRFKSGSLYGDESAATKVVDELQRLGQMA
ncbi:hypothetical protein DGMP_06640 [Desulfomarina profundi]|uniref:Phage tail tape measure protein domain-containing protein n=1 Tax=Desulfomarina profundi TaxID=2772557 RepID=A0A8D5FG17_9BACT|nr:phage tail tape measure protein [Desulfomarina profundi]BCL59971.1 hypothetical protein DGMP_06640 [Desulfomarina profundi]